MYELIVRVLRAVACLPRLRILTRLAHEGEAAPTRLAEDLGMDPDLACAHLAKLTSAGLIQRRRSGVWCYCRAESPYGERTFSGRLAHWLFGVLRCATDPDEHPAVEQVRDVGRREEAVLGLLLEAITAFDNVRRLQVVRLLTERQLLDADTIVRELSMSRAAAGRATSKLVRRGYLSTQRQGHKLFYRAVEQHKTPLHAAVWDLVVTALRQGDEETSRS